MKSIIQTNNLGPVSISRNVIEWFIEQHENDDYAKVLAQIKDILQSTNIERLKLPVTLKEEIKLEFWVHQESSLVFHMIQKDKYKLVSMAIKHDLSEIVFDTN